MQHALKIEIKRLCRRMETRSIGSERKALEYREKFEKRTGLVAGLPPHRTSSLLSHQHFDPAYCARNANFLAKTVWYKVLIGEYQPKPSLRFEVPKTSGGKREIMTFIIPDAALANVVLRRARERNIKRLSPFSYAYHPERDVFDAILALKGFITEQRLFAVQIDFKNYFDSIPSHYLKACIDDPQRISLTPHERAVFSAFMRHQYADRTAYASGTFRRRQIGTPQGSSVSLLLANLANHDLDRALERRSGRFVRFADDIVALCSTYQEAEEIESTFIQHCATSGLKINEEKSPGIAIIGKEAELRNYISFDYLGYRFAKTGLNIPDHVRKRILRKLSSLIHIYLIHYPSRYGFNRTRCSASSQPYDWDLLGLILEIRRYLYGGLDEDELNDFLTVGKKLRRMRGLMGFYALLEDRVALKDLDRWLLVNVGLAMRKRGQILRQKYNVRGLTPTPEQLILGTWLDEGAWKGSGCPNSRLPSFVRGWRAARKYYFTFGLEDAEPPAYAYRGTEYS